MNGLRIPVVVLLGGLSCGACSGGGSPAQPTPAQPSATSGSVRATNTAPSLVLRTVPAMNTTTSPYPTVQGAVPLAVRFNLCPSGDSDPGDSLNWQFNFGDTDSKTPPFLPNGVFNPDFDQFCRVDHTYNSVGSYTATLSVTDKHLDDQSRDASAQARTTTWVTVNVLSSAPAGGSCAINTFTLGGPACLSRGVQALAACPLKFSWTTSGDVSSVTLMRPDSSVISVPANATNFLVTPSGCCTFTLTAMCGDGTKVAAGVRPFV
jgi:hypothetical protein